MASTIANYLSRKILLLHLNLLYEDLMNYHFLKLGSTNVYVPNNLFKENSQTCQL